MQNLSKYFKDFWDEFIFSHEEKWFLLRLSKADTNNNNQILPKEKTVIIHSYDDDGYQKYFYFCGDLSPLINFPWIPCLTWFILNILPFFILPIVVHLCNLKIFIMCPGFLLISVFSCFNIGQTSHQTHNSR